MSEERVTFDKQGGYVKGGSMKDMDVKREETPVEQPTGKSSPQKTAAPTPTAPTTGGFSLSQLKRNVASAKQTAGIQEEPKVAPPVPKPAPEKSVEEVIPDVTEEVTPAEQPDVESVPAEEPIQENPIAEETPVAEEEKPADTVAPKAEFALSQLGLVKESTRTPPEEKPVEHAEFDMDHEEPAGEKMDITGGNEEQPAPVSAAKKPPVEHFNIVPAVDLLVKPYGGEVLEDAASEMKAWIVRVSKEFVRRPATVFVSPNFPNLRAYAIFYLGGRKGTACIGLGKGADFTAVSYNAAKNVLVDMSKNLAISGMCVMAGNSPLAITSLIESSNVVQL